MAENNILKLLYILDLMKKPDENHPLNTTQISENLTALFDNWHTKWR